MVLDHVLPRLQFEVVAVLAVEVDRHPDAQLAVVGMVPLHHPQALQSVERGPSQNYSRAGKSLLVHQLSTHHLIDSKVVIVFVGRPDGDEVALIEELNLLYLFELFDVLKGVFSPSLGAALNAGVLVEADDEEGGHEGGIVEHSHSLISVTVPKMCSFLKANWWCT